MSELTPQTSAADAEPVRTVTAERAAAEAAPGRCYLYGVFSDVVASPFDAEPSVAAEPVDMEGLNLPYDLNSPEPLLAEWRACERDALKREYSGLFEVGSDGPPVPIREDLHLNQPAGVREDIVRFYEFFGYGLTDQFAWAPDHLSVELEFMHFLSYQEAELAEGDALSFQLAQHDFAERHLVNWVSDLAQKTLNLQRDSIYGRLLAALSEFVVKDFEWQASTIRGPA